MENQENIETTTSKWEGKVSSKVDKASADEIWPLLKDFFNFHKWFPAITICRGVHGINGEPGCVRYCASGPEEAPLGWARERAISFDDKTRAMVYEVVESTAGLNSYVSTVKIVPDGITGCVIEWSFTVEPVALCTRDKMVAQYADWLDQMALNMAQSLAQ